MDGIVLAATQAIPIITMYDLLHLLEMTTTVNQEILQQRQSLVLTYTPPILSGMGSSVRASVAAMENLLHGSVWS